MEHKEVTSPRGTFKSLPSKLAKWIIGGLAGFTLLLCNPADRNGELIEKPGTAELHYVVLVTPTVLSPKGQRLHTDAEIEEYAK